MIGLYFPYNKKRCKTESEKLAASSGDACVATQGSGDDMVDFNHFKLQIRSTRAEVDVVGTCGDSGALERDADV